MKSKTPWLLWLVAFVIISQLSFAQTNQAPRPVVTFKQKMSMSDSELKWSKTYYRSYSRTSEIPYLKLSATHCEQALKILMEAQNSLPNTTPYYYKIKQIRYDTCVYYDQLKSVSHQLSSEHHLADVSSLCD